MVRVTAPTVLELNATVAQNQCHSAKPSTLTHVVTIATRVDHGKKESTQEFTEITTSSKLWEIGKDFLKLLMQQALVFQAIAIHQTLKNS